MIEAEGNANPASLRVTLRDTLQITLGAVLPIDLSITSHAEIVRGALQTVACDGTVACSVSLLFVPEEASPPPAPPVVLGDVIGRRAAEDDGSAHDGASEEETLDLGRFVDLGRRDGASGEETSSASSKFGSSSGSGGESSSPSAPMGREKSALGDIGRRGSARRLQGNALVSTNSSLGLRTTNSSLALRLVRERQTANLESQSPSWLLADDDTMLESRLQSLLLHSPLLDGMFVAVPGTNASTRLSLDTIFVQSLNRTSLGAIVTFVARSNASLLYAVADASKQLPEWLADWLHDFRGWEQLSAPAFVIQLIYGPRSSAAAADVVGVGSKNALTGGSEDPTTLSIWIGSMLVGALGLIMMMISFCNLNKKRLLKQLEAEKQAKQGHALDTAPNLPAGDSTLDTAPRRQLTDSSPSRGGDESDSELPSSELIVVDAVEVSESDENMSTRHHIARSVRYTFLIEAPLGVYLQQASGYVFVERVIPDLQAHGEGVQEGSVVLGLDRGDGYTDLTGIRCDEIIAQIEASPRPFTLILRPPHSAPASVYADRFADRHMREARELQSPVGGGAQSTESQRARRISAISANLGNLGEKLDVDSKTDVDGERHGEREDEDTADVEPPYANNADRRLPSRPDSRAGRPNLEASSRGHSEWTDVIRKHAQPDESKSGEPKLGTSSSESKLGTSSSESKLGTSSSFQERWASDEVPLAPVDEVSYRQSSALASWLQQLHAELVEARKPTQPEPEAEHKDADDEDSPEPPMPPPPRKWGRMPELPPSEPPPEPPLERSAPRKWGRLADEYRGSSEEELRRRSRGSSDDELRRISESKEALLLSVLRAVRERHGHDVYRRVRTATHDVIARREAYAAAQTLTLLLGEDRDLLGTLSDLLPLGEGERIEWFGAVPWVYRADGSQLPSFRSAPPATAAIEYPEARSSRDRDRTEIEHTESRSPPAAFSRALLTALEPTPPKPPLDSPAQWPKRTPPPPAVPQLARARRPQPPTEVSDRPSPPPRKAWSQQPPAPASRSPRPPPTPLSRVNLELISARSPLSRDRLLIQEGPPLRPPSSTEESSDSNRSLSPISSSGCSSFSGVDVAPARPVREASYLSTSSPSTPRTPREGAQEGAASSHVSPHELTRGPSYAANYGEISGRSRAVSGEFIGPSYAANYDAAPRAAAAQSVRREELAEISPRSARDTAREAPLAQLVRREEGACGASARKWARHSSEQEELPAEPLVSSLDPSAGHASYWAPEPPPRRSFASSSSPRVTSRVTTPLARLPFQRDLDREIDPFQRDLDREIDPFQRDLDREIDPFQRDLGREIDPRPSASSAQTSSDQKVLAGATAWLQRAEADVKDSPEAHHRARGSAEPTPYAYRPKLPVSGADYYTVMQITPPPELPAGAAPHAPRKWGRLEDAEDEVYSPYSTRRPIAEDREAAGEEWPDKEWPDQEMRGGRPRGTRDGDASGAMSGAAPSAATSRQRPGKRPAISMGARPAGAASSACASGYTSGAEMGAASGYASEASSDASVFNSMATMRRVRERSRALKPAAMPPSEAPVVPVLPTLPMMPVSLGAHTTAMQRVQSLRLGASGPERDGAQLELPRMSFRPPSVTLMEPSPQESQMRWLQDQRNTDQEDSPDREDLQT